MATTVFPETADSVTEATWVALNNAMAGGGSWRASGFDVTYDGSGLDIDIAAGTAIVGGYYVNIDSASEITGLTASNTNYLWLESDGTLSANTTGSAPSSGALCLGTATTNGSAVTAVSADVAVTVGPVRYAKKTADESVTSSTTLQDDDALTMTLPAGLWRITLVLKMTWTTNNGFKVAIASTATNAALAAMIFHGSNTAATYGSAFMSTLGTAYSYASGGAAGTGIAVLIEGTVPLADDGVVKLQFAQATSHGDSTTVGTGSFFVAERVG